VIVVDDVVVVILFPIMPMMIKGFARTRGTKEYIDQQIAFIVIIVLAILLNLGPAMEFKSLILVT
jgi:hypothetical protein